MAARPPQPTVDADAEGTSVESAVLAAGSVVAQEIVFTGLLGPIIEIPKTLVQLGYEPNWAGYPVKYTNFLGMSGWIRPGFLKICSHLMDVHGKSVLLTGFTTRVLERLTFRLVFNTVQSSVESIIPEQMFTRAHSDAALSRRVFNSTVTSVISHCAAVAACHPFRVLGVRLIAQLVDPVDSAPLYTPYGWLQIFQNEGPAGLLAGIETALIAEAAQAVVLSVTAALTFEFLAPLLLGSQNDDNEDDVDDEAESKAELERRNQWLWRQAISVQLASSLGNPLYYPWQVARSMMVVTGTELEVAKRVPTFSKPWDCYDYLARKSVQNSAHLGLMRGSDIIRRFTWRW